MYSTKFKIGIIALTLQAGVVFSQPVNNKLDHFFTELANKKELNGNILVARNGKTIYKKSFGYANFEQKRLNSFNTEFQIASISKIFTGISILQLVEKGKIALDDNFDKYFPAFPYPGITIRQMLSHSSGLSDQDLAPVFAAYQAKYPDKILTNQDLVPILAETKTPLKLQPGEKWWYSNTGFQLLAALVEKISRQPFDKYLKQHIWVPAKMQHTYVKNALLHAANTANFADNYDYPSTFEKHLVKKEGKAGYYTSGVSGHSNIISTTGDFLRFDQALYTGILLKKATLELATSPAKLRNGDSDFVWLDIGGMGKADDGLGWFIFKDTTQGKIVWHAGGMPGCATIFFRNLTKKETVILFDNTNSEKLYRKGLSAMRILNGQSPLVIKKSLSRLYAKALFGKGSIYADSLLNRLKNDTLHYILAENDMVNLGYEFMEKKHLTQALATFYLGSQLYPASDNMYSSYGDALVVAGRKEEAIAMYNKSLLLNPKNEDSRKALKELEAKITKK